MIKLSVLKNRHIVGWKPEFFGCLGYIVSMGIPSIPIPIPEEIKLLMYVRRRAKTVFEHDQSWST